MAADESTMAVRFFFGFFLIVFFSSGNAARPSRDAPATLAIGRRLRPMAKEATLPFPSFSLRNIFLENNDFFDGVEFLGRLRHFPCEIFFSFFLLF